MIRTNTLSLFFTATITAALLTFGSCSDEPTSPPPPVSPRLSVSVLETAYDSVTLAFHINGRSEPGNFIIECNSFQIWGFQEIRDTVFVHRGLPPSMDLRYRLLELRGMVDGVWDFTLIDSSDYIYTRTKDPTSSEFEWETVHFGLSGSSHFRDIAVIAPDDIWAVGDLYYDWVDSLNRTLFYNAAHWNGQDWTKHLIPFKRIMPGGQIDSIKAGTINAVMADAKGKIWFFSQSGGVTRITEGKIDIMVLSALETPSAANAVWRRSDDDFTVACDGGYLWHWNGAKFNQIGLGTTQNVVDIWGVGDTAICLACNKDENGDTEVFQIIGETATRLPSEGLPKRMKSLWYERKEHIFAVGSFTMELRNGQWLQMANNSARWYQMRVRGAANDDIFIAAQQGEFFHFNGWEWKKLDVPGVTVYSLALQYDGRDAYIVGFMDGKAAFIHGRRKGT